MNPPALIHVIAGSHPTLPRKLSDVLSVKSGLPAISGGDSLLEFDKQLASQGHGGFYPGGATGQEFYAGLPHSLQVDPHDASVLPAWFAALAPLAAASLFGGGGGAGGLLGPLIAAGGSKLPSWLGLGGSGGTDSPDNGVLGSNFGPGVGQLSSLASGNPLVGAGVSSIANDINTGDVIGGIGDSFAPGIGGAISGLFDKSRDLTPTQALSQQNLAASANPTVGAPQGGATDTIRQNFLDKGVDATTARQQIMDAFNAGQLDPQTKDSLLASLSASYGGQQF